MTVSVSVKNLTDDKESRTLARSLLEEYASRKKSVPYTASVVYNLWHLFDTKLPFIRKRAVIVYDGDLKGVLFIEQRSDDDPDFGLWRVAGDRHHFNYIPPLDAEYFHHALAHIGAINANEVCRTYLSQTKLDLPFTKENYTIPLTYDSLKSYLASLPKKHRSYLQNCLNKNADVTVGTNFQQSDLLALMSSYKSYWIERGFPLTALRIDSEVPFMLSQTENCLVTVLSIRGKVAAINLAWITDDICTDVVCLRYVDNSEYSKRSLGTLAIIKTIEICISKGIKFYSLAHDENAYKSKFCANGICGLVLKQASLVDLVVDGGSLLYKGQWIDSEQRSLEIERNKMHMPRIMSIIEKYSLG